MRRPPSSPRLRGGICRYSTSPSRMVTSNSSPRSGARRTCASALPSTSPCALRTTTSRGGGGPRRSRSCSRRASAACQAHPTSRLSTSTLPATASQMRRYSLREMGEFQDIKKLQLQ